MTRKQNFSRTGILNIVFQILYLVLLYFFANRAFPELSGLMNLCVRLLIVFVPCGLWTLFFYLQDRIEPEPTRYVAAAFIAGMAGAGLFILPMFDSLFLLNEWIHDSMFLLSAGSVLVVGATISSMFYIVIHYGFYPSREFDEPVDGMVYGAFTGAGFAAVESLRYLSAHPDYTLFAMGYTAASNVIVYASVGSIVGYFVGKNKFTDKHSASASLFGIVIGMVLLGSYGVLKEFIFLSGFREALWISFILTIVFGAAILSFVYRRMRALTAVDLRQDKDVFSRIEIPVLGLFVVLAVSGYLLKQYATQDVVFTNPKYGLSFQYPHWFTPQPLRNRSLARPAVFGSSPQIIFNAVGFHNGNVTFSVNARNGKADLSSLNISDYIGATEKISLTAEPVTINGKSGTRLKYSYIDRNHTAFENFPDVNIAFADIIPLENQTLIFSFMADRDVFEREYPNYEKLLTTIQWSAE